MSAQHDGQVRYLVHFSEGGSGMRWFDEPLEEVALIREGDVEYVVTRVVQPKAANGLGHAWAELA